MLWFFSDWIYALYVWWWTLFSSLFVVLTASYSANVARRVQLQIGFALPKSVWNWILHANKKVNWCAAVLVDNSFGRWCWWPTELLNATVDSMAVLLCLLVWQIHSDDFVFVCWSVGCCLREVERDGDLVWCFCLEQKDVVRFFYRPRTSDLSPSCRCSVVVERIFACAWSFWAQDQDFGVMNSQSSNFSVKF